MSDPTKNAERIKRLWDEVRECTAVYVLITTQMGPNQSLPMRACKAFRYDGRPDRIGLVREKTCPAGNTTIQAFCTTKYRESPIPILLFGNGFFDEDTRAMVNLYWPQQVTEPDELPFLSFEGELLESGDHYGRFVNLEDARTKSEFNLKFVNKGMSLRALIQETDRDGHLPLWLLPSGSRVFPPIVEITREIFESLRKVFPSRLFIQAGYNDRDTFTAVPIELPSTWDPQRPGGSKLRAISGKLFDIVEIVRERPMFIPDADELEDELDAAKGAEARLKGPDDTGIALDGANGAAPANGHAEGSGTNGSNGAASEAAQPAHATT